MKHAIKKHPLSFYWDYLIKNGFLYVYQETKDGRVHTEKVCATTKDKVDSFEDTGKNIIVQI